jgi:hypothetical protein
MSEEVSTVAFAVEFVDVQGSVAFGAGRGGAASRQVPALLAVTFAPQHVHARQPEMERTEEEQQQPERHRLVPQSKLLAQASPGEASWHAPVNGAHAEQPALRAFAEQQKPPRHACEAQLPLSVQAAPGEKKKVDVGVGVTEPVLVPVPVGVCVLVAVGVGEAETGAQMAM